MQSQALILFYAPTQTSRRKCQADAVTFQTEPGSVVYVPHGHWHATEASELSLAVLFTVNQEDWVSMITKKISAQLRQREAWREIPIGIRNPNFWRSRHAFVSELLADLKATADLITPDDLMSKFGGPFVLRYRVRDGIRLKVSSSGKNNKRAWILTISVDGKSASREIPPQLAKVCKWVIDNKLPFTGKAAIKALPTVDPEFIRKLLANYKCGACFK